jgi:hypothetical protein
MAFLAGISSKPKLKTSVTYVTTATGVKLIEQAPGVYVRVDNGQPYKPQGTNC